MHLYPFLLVPIEDFLNELWEDPRGEAEAEAPYFVDSRFRSKAQLHSGQLAAL